MSRRRKPKGLHVDPEVKAALQVDRAVASEQHFMPKDVDAIDRAEVLQLRSMLARIADMVGARAFLLLREARVETLANIERRLGEHALLQENMHWREYAWLSCPHPEKYGDDGEMQCTPPLGSGGVQADFRRGKIEDLSEHLRVARGFTRLSDIPDKARRDRTYEAAAQELFPDPPRAVGRLEASAREAEAAVASLKAWEGRR